VRYRWHIILKQHAKFKPLVGRPGNIAPVIPVFLSFHIAKGKPGFCTLNKLPVNPYICTISIGYGLIICPVAYAYIINGIGIYIVKHFIISLGNKLKPPAPHPEAVVIAKNNMYGLLSLYVRVNPP